MTDPSHKIPVKQPHEDKRGKAEDDWEHKPDQSHGCTDEVEPAVSAVAMLREIEGEELFEGLHVSNIRGFPQFAFHF